MDMSSFFGPWIYPAITLELLFLMITTASIALASQVSLPRVEKVCDLEEFEAQCSDGEVIVVEAARYGRMEIGDCVKVDMGFIGCQYNAQEDADRMCSGKSSCRIRIPNNIFEKHKPCFAELKSYLEISYSCQYVLPETNHCDNRNNNNITITNGYISSHMATNESCGSESRPWVISAKSGQIINLTVVNFDVQSSYSTGTRKHYGKVKDINEETDIWGGQKRIIEVYKSIGNQVEVTLGTPVNSETHDPVRFLIYFEILGCADEVPQPGMWYKRLSHDRAKLGCEDSKIDTVWYLHCQGRNWAGLRANCSAPQYGKIDTPRKRAHDMKYGLAVAIILGAIIGVIIIFVLFWIIRYRRYCLCRRPESSGSNYTTNTMLLHPRRQVDEYQLRCTCPVPPPQQKVHDRTLRPHRASPDTRTATLHRSPQVPRHYSLSQTVQVNGNEYEHIWQTPLPKPRTISTDTAPSTEDNANSDGEGENANDAVTDSLLGTDNQQGNGYTQYKTDNTENEDRDRPYYIRSKDIYNGSPKQDCRTVAGYSTLRKKSPPADPIITACPADV